MNPTAHNEALVPIALQSAGDPNAPVAPSGALLAHFLTPEELAAQLGISPRTLNRWHALRRGPPRLMIGRKPYYRGSSVEKWLESRERGFDDAEPPRRRHA
jgi:predicted DNA-binding transcriptional regulator AlpA